MHQKDLLPVQGRWMYLKIRRDGEIGWISYPEGPRMSLCLSIIQPDGCLVITPEELHWLISPQTIIEYELVNPDHTQKRIEEATRIDAGPVLGEREE